MALNSKAAEVSYERNLPGQNSAVKSLALCEARFQALFDNSFDAILFMKPSGQITLANATACRLFGYTKQELTQIEWTSIVVIDSCAAAAANDLEALSRATDGLTFRRKDGSTFDGEFTAAVFTEPNGEKSVSVIIRDVTNRLRVERELKEGSQKIRAMNEKLRVVGSLIRHDVRNKLSIINANVYLLKKRIGTDPELTKYLDAITAAVASSDKLFEFSRLYEKIGAEELTQINVGECFNEATALVPNLAGINVVNECQGLVVMADSLLRQLFYNLIDNSIRHGYNVKQIRVYCARGESGVKVFYEDDGIGIADENKPKLFTEGYTTGNGSGLGLRLVKRMVDVYGWSIREIGTPGKGVRFEITIPGATTQGKTAPDFL